MIILKVLACVGVAVLLLAAVIFLVIVIRAARVEAKIEKMIRQIEEEE